MDRFQRGFILDNPDLSSAVVSKFLGVTKYHIGKFKKELDIKTNMNPHNGHRVPYVVYDSSRMTWRLKAPIDGKEVLIHSDYSRAVVFCVLDAYNYALKSGFIKKLPVSKTPY